MTYEDMVEISAKIDEILTKKKLTFPEAVHVVSFHIAKMLFLLGIQEEAAADAVDAIAQDMKDGFKRISESVVAYEQEDNIVN